ncbi:MAG: DUF167 domain-containing protein [Thermosulfidibacteraceae bacterium]|jgi:uncharacterized protein (TIGR00251 family)
MKDSILINCKVTAGSKRRDLSIEKDLLKVWVCACREKGKANKELVEFLSEVIEVSKSDIEIVKGEWGTLKTVKIRGVSLEEFKERVRSWKR